MSKIDKDQVINSQNEEDLPSDQELYCLFQGELYSKGAILNTGDGRIECIVDTGKFPYWKKL